MIPCLLLYYIRLLKRIKLDPECVASQILFKKLGRAVGRRDRRSIANQIILDKKLAQLAAEKIGKQLQCELVSSVSLSSNSLYTNKDKQCLKSFKWLALCKDLQRTAPLLSIILQKCIETNRCNVHKPDKNVLIAVIAGILLRNRSQLANFLQSVVSMILYSSHCPKQVQ